MKGEAIALAKTGERQELLDLLAMAEEPLSLAKIAAAVGKKTDAVRHLLKPIVDEGAIYQPGYGKYAFKRSQFSQEVQSDQADSLF